jgi:outer membrane protein, heavy metal efflux system
VIAVLLALVVLQDSARATTPIQLDDVYRAVLASNQRIAAATAVSTAATARTYSVRRPPDPQLQLGLMNYALPSMRPMETLGMAQVQVMQTLPIGGKLSQAGRVADLVAASEQERSTETRWIVRAEAAAAFFDLYRADRSLAITRESLRLMNEAYSVAEAMYRIGGGRQADVLRAQLEVSRMAQDTLRATATRTAVEARLTAMGAIGSASNAEPLLPAFPETVLALDRLQALVADRPMLRAMQRGVEAAGAQVSLARKEIWPDLVVGVQASEGTAGAGWMGSAMIGASLPIFARDRQIRMRDEADAMRQMAEADLANGRAETNALLIETRADLIRARTLSALYHSTTLPQAEAAAASALAEYRVGQVDFMTALDGRLAVDRYKMELAELEADEGKSWAKLEALMGRELFDPRATSVAYHDRRLP